jgi:hypothetical protein
MKLLLTSQPSSWVVTYREDWLLSICASAFFPIDASAAAAAAAAVVAAATASVSGV